MEIKYLYNADENSRLKKRLIVYRVLIAVFCAAYLSVCVSIMLSSNAITADSSEIAVVIINAVCGSAVILAWINLVVRGKREYEHSNNMLSGEMNTVEYSLKPSLSAMTFDIPRSVTVKNVTVNTIEGPLTLHIYGKKSGIIDRLPESGTLYTVKGYIVAYSECKEAM